MELKSRSSYKRDRERNEHTLGPRADSAAKVLCTRSVNSIGTRLEPLEIGAALANRGVE